jgi:hydroxyacylglutathione hydrolase
MATITTQPDPNKPSAVTASVEMTALVDEGLGNSSYLVELGDGRALAIDPGRDPAPYRALAQQRGLRLAFAAETHLHADFVSGSRELAATGATVLGSAAGRREFPHRGLEDGDEVDLGGLTLRALATPGHTPEHLAYLVLDGSRPLALFTGGSLLVGAVARTDLISPDRTEELARAMYRSIHSRLLALPDDLRVFPTHGAGSFCSAPAGAERTTTIGRERAGNPLLSASNEDVFVARLLAGLGTYPPYFGRLQAVNRRGPRVYGSFPGLRPLSVSEVHRLVAEGAELVDTRSVADFAAGHIPGSLSIPLRPAFGTWLGWVVPPARPLVFVAAEGQDRAEIVRQALTVGYEEIAGELDGGIAAWRAAGDDVSRVALVTPTSVPPSTVVDVRQTSEFETGHLPGSVHAELGSLVTSVPPATGPLTLLCGHGERAMTAASLLERVGRTELAVVVGGPEDWAAVPGNRLAVGR